MLALSADGAFLASWEGDSNEIVLWDLKTGKETWKFAVKGDVHGSRVRMCLAFAPDGKTLAAGSVAAVHDVRLFALTSGKERGRLQGSAGG